MPMHSVSRLLGTAGDTASAFSSCNPPFAVTAMEVVSHFLVTTPPLPVQAL